jgi:hypothetical protein
LSKQGRWGNIIASYWKKWQTTFSNSKKETISLESKKKSINKTRSRIYTTNGKCWLFGESILN